VSSFAFERRRGVAFGLGFLKQSSRLVFGNLKSAFGIFLDDSRLNVSFDVAFHLVCFSFLYDFIFKGCGSGFGESLDVLRIDQSTSLLLHGIDLLELLFGLLFDLSLEQVDLLDILSMLQGHQILHVVSLQSQGQLVFVVVDD